MTTSTHEPCRANRLLTLIGLVLLIGSNMILLLVFGWHRTLILSGIIGAFGSLWLLIRYSCCLETFNTGATLILFGTAFMALTHLVLLALGLPQATPLTDLHIYSGQVDTLQTSRASTKSDTVLQFTLKEFKQDFALSSAQVGLSRLKSLEHVLHRRPSIKLWCKQITVFAPCRIQQLQYQNTLLVNPQQIAKHRAAVWHGLALGWFLFVLAGLLIIFLSVLKKLAIALYKMRKA